MNCRGRKATVAKHPLNDKAEGQHLIRSSAIRSVNHHKKAELGYRCLRTYAGMTLSGAAGSSTALGQRRRSAWNHFSAGSR